MALQTGVEGIDTSFFEPDYTVAAATAELIWEGSWTMIELLRDELAPRVEGGRRVVELGSGTGLLGLCAAAVGGHVLLTDIAAVAKTSLKQNVLLNSSSSSSNAESAGSSSTSGGSSSGAAAAGAADSGAPSADAPAAASSVSSVVDGVDGGTVSTPGEDAGESWAEAVPVGVHGGSASAAALDWTVPVTDQTAPNDPRNADLLIACECVWLEELAGPFVDTIFELMQGPKSPACLLCYRDRSNAASATFAGMGHVVGLFEARGCTVKMLHSKLPTTKRDREKCIADPTRPVNVFEVTLG